MSKTRPQPKSDHASESYSARDSSVRPLGNKIYLWVIFLGITFGSMGLMTYLRLPPSQAPQLTYKVLNTFPHDRTAFTQGLFIQNGRMYESTGRFKQSSLRIVDVTTGNQEITKNLPDNYFAEGIATFGSKLYQLTFQNYKIRIYDKDSLELIEEREFPFEGWGLTSDADYLILSDGSSTIRYLDPETLKVVSKINVRDGRQAISEINELEYFDGRIYANVWREDVILQIQPATGRVTGKIDMSGLLDEIIADDGACLNGIAVNKETNTFYVTGKLWPKMFEVKFVEKPPEKNE